MPDTDTTPTPSTARKWHFVLPGVVSFLLFYPILLAPGFIAAYLIVILSPADWQQTLTTAVTIILTALGVWMTYGLAMSSGKALGRGRNWWMWTLDVVRTFSFKILYGIARVLRVVFGISQAKFESGFVAFNNSLLASRHFTLIKDRPILLLLPHCLQRKECDVRLLTSAQNCKACGECNVTDLVALAEESGLSIALVNGGELARQQITELKPAAVLAVACERELASGIQDSFPVPVWGVLNERPRGYCTSTIVDMERVRASLAYLAGKGPVPKPTA